MFVHKSFTMKKFRILLLALVGIISTNYQAQVSYEEFHASYKPHNEVLVKNSNVVSTYESLGSDKYAAGILYLLQEIPNDPDLKLNLSAILTSANREKVAEGLEGLSTSQAVTALTYMKESWQVELLYFVNKSTYHNLAPHLSGMVNWEPGSTDKLFQKEVNKLNPLYAGIGLDLAWSGLKGMNTYVDAINNSNSFSTVDGHEFTKAGGFKGFNVIGGFKLNNDWFADVNFQRRSTVSSASGEGGNTWDRDIRFAMNTINLDFMYMRQTGFFSVAQGMGLQFNMGSLSERNTLNNANYSTLGSTSNLGLKYVFGFYLVPKDLPVIFAARPYFQLNLTKMDFSSMGDLYPNLNLTESSKTSSSATNLGVQFNVAYRFGKQQEKVEYPSFDDEILADMDPHLNTAYSELLPRITPDGKTLYFVREGHPLNTKGTLASQDIWVSDVSNGIENATATHLGSPFNGQINNAVAGISPDENSMVIKGAYVNGKYEGLGYSKVTRTKDGWSAPEKLEIEDYENMSKGKYISAYWTQDGKHMILSFSESSTDDAQDMYVSFLQEDGKWSRPMSLGKEINTAFGENSPFLASDGKTLYFSSNRGGGEGNYDIWMSKRLDDTWKKWSKPENLGKEVNTASFDAYYTIDAQGKYAYMVSGENSKGLEDIIRIELAQELQPDPVVLINGKVINAKTNEPLEANISYNGLLDGKNYGIARTNPATGEYKIVLPYGNKYDFTANAGGFVGVSSNLDLSDVGEYKVIERDLYLVPIEVGSKVRLNNIFFETGKATLKQESYVELDRVVDLLTENPNMKIELSGHTDNVGNDAFNKNLSKERAESCKAYLVSKGVSEDRLISAGYGKDQPVADNGTEEGRALNRRVEIKILEIE